jgi:hypothetical protein
MVYALPERAAPCLKVVLKSLSLLQVLVVMLLLLVLCYYSVLLLLLQRKRSTARRKGRLQEIQKEEPLNFRITSPFLAL